MWIVAPGPASFAAAWIVRSALLALSPLFASFPACASTHRLPETAAGCAASAGCMGNNIETITRTAGISELAWELDRMEPPNSSGSWQSSALLRVQSTMGKEAARRVVGALQGNGMRWKHDPAAWWASGLAGPNGILAGVKAAGASLSELIGLRPMGAAQSTVQMPK